MRIDDRAGYDPFGWRIAQMKAAAAGGSERRPLLESLVVCEAEELAAGRQHLTIVHGDPDNIFDSRHLSAFYDTLGRLVAEAEWARVRGEAEFVTVTIAGPDAGPIMSMVASAAEVADPGWWRITESPYPDVL